MNKIIIYILGAVTGAAATYVYCKEKYQRENSQDAQEVREYYKNLYSNNEKDDYKDLTEEYDGSKDIDNRDPDENVAKEEIKNSASIIFIGEELFGEDDRFVDETIFLYSDGVFTDADRDPISDVTKLIGNNVKKILNTDEDSIYIRNYLTNREYEILRLEEEYSEEE